MNTARMTVLFLCVISANAQLTRDQRLADFRNLADVYAKRYAFIDWKREAAKFDALNIGPWLDRVAETQSDLEFFALMAEYVARLADAHDVYLLPSTYTAALGFTVDIYDGKYLVDSIDRERLPEAEFAFQVGDEVVSMDGKPVAEVAAGIEKFVAASNARSARRDAAGQLTSRSQDSFPLAHKIPDVSAIVIRRQSGEEVTYQMRWRKRGLPVEFLPANPGIRVTAAKAGGKMARLDDSYLAPLRELQTYALETPPAVLGIEVVAPLFAMPEGFEQRLGAGRLDEVFSGVITADDLRIGFLRIPSFFLSFSGDRQIEAEIAFFRANTDGLVIDVMRNPGGFGCDPEAYAQLVMPEPFRLLGAEARFGWIDILSVNLSLDNARARQAPAETIAQLEALLKEYDSAYLAGRPRTSALPICGTTLDGKPKTGNDGSNIAYSKPLMLLLDEFTASAAEIFAALIQDNARGKLFGMGTVGAGGSVVRYPAGVYSEGSTSVTRSILIRKNPIVTPDYPTAPYIENIGVRPEIVADIMTRENLLNKGKPFLDAFVAAMVAHIRASR